MFAIGNIIFLIIISLCHGIPTTDRQCLPDTIDFNTKVEKSSIVVYGKVMAKMLDEESDSTFHVFFQVDCILKGPATLRQINITNAGHIEGKKYCQDFSVGRGYSIAFLEPISSNTTDYYTFIPADFVEILVEENSTNLLLARTCNLHQIVPRQSSALAMEVCPAVSTDPICHETVNVTITAMTIDSSLMNTTNDFLSDLTTDDFLSDLTTNDILSDLTTNNLLSDVTTNLSNEIVSTSNENELLPSPIDSVEQEINAIRSKSNIHQIDVDQHNNAKSITYSTLFIIMAIIFCSN
ncbi:unnamed protein product [Rotaria sordida]|uniref:Uncharacterized protein n=1 Tax=Rotaria sordida TaxID=392033 RepID=A0A819N441_9BILA|nr:unnamed protein product [Rotaria sordida]CAF0894027.1 unnamed protein product [Rotaria sordida]CAF3988036.1 unnamed protein product [Rotaria sordida]CAF4022542.1 unnamed protein product [Rotaria sordida]